MNNQYWIWFSVILFSVGIWIGAELGVHVASERFYDECQGGEMHYKTSSGETLTAVGCAEMARHVR